MRNLPGRKTDVSDAVWLADPLARGLIRDSFVPPLPIQDLRDLTRTRKQLRQEMTRHTRRIYAARDEKRARASELRAHRRATKAVF